MREFKGTPGIWKQSHRPIPKNKKGMYDTQVYTEDGETIATISWYPKPREKGVINGKNVFIIGSYREANAKLIAAAPEMFETIKELLSLLEFHGYNNSTEIYNAKQLLTKITQ